MHHKGVLCTQLEYVLRVHPSESAESTYLSVCVCVCVRARARVRRLRATIPGVPAPEIVIPLPRMFGLVFGPQSGEFGGLWCQSASLLVVLLHAPETERLLAIRTHSLIRASGC